MLGRVGHDGCIGKSSLSIFSPSRIPQCPCEVYSQRQTSAASASGRPSRRSSLNVSDTGPCGSSAPDPCGSFASGMPNSSTPPTPSSANRCASRSARSPESLAWPLREGISWRSACPPITKSGAMSCRGSSLVSRTRSRSAGLARRRRGRSGPGVVTAGRNISSRIFPHLDWNRPLDRISEVLDIRHGGLGRDAETSNSSDGAGARSNRDRRQLGRTP